MKTVKELFLGKYELHLMKCNTKISYPRREQLSITSALSGPKILLSTILRTLNIPICILSMCQTTFNVHTDAKLYFWTFELYVV